MTTPNEWEQYALITYIADKTGSSGRLGKKALQKYVFLLNELEGVPSGYKFRLYTYGPYSSELSGDLDVVNSLGGVNVSYDPIQNVFSISKGEKSSVLLNKAAGFLNLHRARLNRFFERFGGRLAKDLELTATIVYLVKSDAVKVRDKTAFIQKVRDLKPKYDSETVERFIEELRSYSYVS